MRANLCRCLCSLACPPPAIGCSLACAESPPLAHRDFASLYQTPRTEEETPLFRLGLRGSNVWYGHIFSVVWIQPTLPDGLVATSYEDSGWCFVEAALSATLKPSERRVNISKYRPGKDASPFLFTLSHDGCLKGSRAPPLMPAKVAHVLEHDKVFFARADVAVVAGLYATFFDAVAPAQRTLSFSKLGWADEEAAQLAEVLPFFGKLERLDLSDNKVGAEGARALAPTLVHASVTSVRSPAHRTPPICSPLSLN